MASSASTNFADTPFLVTVFVVSNVASALHQNSSSGKLPGNDIGSAGS